MNNTKKQTKKELIIEQARLLHSDDFCDKRYLIEINRELLYRERKSCKHTWGHFGTSMGKTRQTPKQEFKCSICGVKGLMEYNEVYHPAGVKAKYIR